jgi:hypothetical protein
MRSISLLVLAVALAACEKPPVPGNAAPSAESASSVQPVPSALPVASASASADTPSSEPESKPVLLDSEHAKTVISGCLAAAKGMPERSESATRAAPAGPSVQIVRAPKLHVVHRLAHACCLSAQTRVELSANVVSLVEEISGTPCRCQCESTLDTELALAPGSYELRVVTIRSNERSETFRGALEVQGAGAPASPAKLPRSIHVPPSAAQPR